ncbi:MAG: AAA family ATPase [Lachnospiraceae bacterium]|nr:AAA family ATPase [Lachnospiraceae bacterium]
MRPNGANVKIVQNYIPWYADEYRISSYAEKKKITPAMYSDLTPQDIYKNLIKDVVDQDEACRKVSVMMYRHIRGSRFVGMLAGPTGSGKSFIAESLSKMFPDVIYIRDISNVSCDGWTGSKKVNDLFHGVKTADENPGKINPVIFLDECDKMFKPKYAAGKENVSESVQAEFLTVIQGGMVLVSPENYRVTKKAINTAKISFLFAGAFEKKAEAIAEAASGPSLGFGASFEKAKPYSRELTMDDVMQAGCMRELCGRIQKIINLNPFSEEDFRQILDITDRGPLYELEHELEMPIRISEDRKNEIAHNAYASGLGIRGMKNSIREYADELIWDDCKAKVLEIA